MPTSSASGQERAGFHHHLLVVTGQFAGDILAVGLLQHGNQAGGTEVARGELGRVQQHAQLPVRAADEGGFSHLRHLLHGVVHLRHEPAQREMIVARTVKCQRQDRHVVNGPGLDERLRNAVRNFVELDCSFWFSFTRLRSMSSPTLKRTMTSDWPSLEVE